MKNIKHIFYIQFILLAFLSLNACVEPDPQVYTGPALVHFPEPSASYFVSRTEDPGFNLRVGLTIPNATDRQYTVVIDEEESTAIRNVHYTVADLNVTVPAGQFEGVLRIDGNFENLGTAETLVFSLLDDQGNASFRQDFTLTMSQFCPYVQEDFVGAFLASSTFRAATVTNKPVTVLPGRTANEIVVQSLYTTGLDIIITLDDSNPSNFVATTRASGLPTFGQHVWNDGRFVPPNIYITPTSAASPGVFSACNGTITLTLRHCLDPSDGRCFGGAGAADVLTLTKVQD
jgi:hypothetical protein